MKTLEEIDQLIAELKRVADGSVREPGIVRAVLRSGAIAAKQFENPIEMKLSSAMWGAKQAFLSGWDDEAEDLDI